MKILFLGDIMGRSGRIAVIENVPRLRQELDLDFIIVNAENTSSGRGLNKAHANQLLESGVDVITLGDHAFDQRDMLQFIEREPRILRPLNYAKGAPGKGVGMFTSQSGQKLLVAQALGRVFMNKPYDDPFSALDAALKAAPLGGAAKAVIVDFHAEATSEKMAMGHFLDGRASLVVGTHTHVPTNDAMILPKGTAYQTDAGMCGDYHSVIGMKPDEPLRRFVTGMHKDRFSPATGAATLFGVLLEVDVKTGQAIKIESFRQGAVLGIDHA